MEILTNEVWVIESDGQRKGLGESLMFLINHMCRLQESNIVLWWKQVHTPGIVGQKHRYLDAPRNYLRDHVRSHATIGVRIYQIDDSIYGFQLFQQIDCIGLGIVLK